MSAKQWTPLPTRKEVVDKARTNNDSLRRFFNRFSLHLHMFTFPKMVDGVREYIAEYALSMTASETGHSRIAKKGGKSDPKTYCAAIIEYLSSEKNDPIHRLVLAEFFGMTMAGAGIDLQVSVIDEMNRLFDEFGVPLEYADCQIKSCSREPKDVGPANVISLADHPIRLSKKV